MEEYQKTVMRVSTVTLLGNLILVFFKILIGFISFSNAIISDGIHTASDVLSTVVVMVGVKLSSKESDLEHPYGHERFECVAAIILAVMLFLTALLIGYSGIIEIINPSNVKLKYGSLAIVIAVISIVAKEAMYWYTIIEAKRINSNAMKADAWHHRSDAFSSIGSLVGVIGFYLGYYILDAIASILICGFILKVAIEIFNDAIDQMIDHACSREFQEDLISLITEQSEIINIDDLKTRLFGNKVYVDLEVQVDGNDNLRHAHAIAHQVHDLIENNFPTVKHCNVHVNPSDS